MNVILEYLKLIPKALKNADKLVEGIINNTKLENGNLSKEEQDEIIKRRLICAGCPFSSSNAVSNPALNYKTDRYDNHCIWCKCNIDLKTASLESDCGITAYNEEHPESPMDLKWTKYIKPKENE